MRNIFKKKIIFISVIFLLFFSFANAIELTSPSFIIKDPVVGTGSGFGDSTNFQSLSSMHTSFSDIGSSSSFIGRYGFLYFPFVTKPVLTAVANGSSADISWTASNAGLGWSVGDYRVGKASISGGPYSYTNVGITTNYSYIEQPPGDYCFVVQTLDNLGYVISTSNEDCITILPVLSFDLDTAVTSVDTNAPYSVSLGVLSISDVKSSGATDNINMIMVEADTNAVNGVVVSVRNTNGANGLVSLSSPSDNIGSATATMSSGTENYGLCVITSSLLQFVRVSPYNTGSCATNSNTNDVKALTTTGESILSSSGSPVYGAYAEISVNGSVSAVTPAHNDYSDTLTFVVTGTF